MTLVPWRHFRVPRPRPDAGHQASLLEHYRESPLAERERLPDEAWRQWAERRS
jgi:hypothetical protein